MNSEASSRPTGQEGQPTTSSDAAVRREVMSVDNISLGSQGLDELVPSRYALQVGDSEVLVISDGVLPISGETIAYNADSADLSAWLDDNFLPPQILEWPLNVAVVRTGDQT